MDILWAPICYLLSVNLREHFPPGARCRHISVRTRTAKRETKNKEREERHVIVDNATTASKAQVHIVNVWDCLFAHTRYQ